MDYIGSKTKLVGWIAGHLQRHMNHLGMKAQNSRFLDACAGTGAVTAHMATLGFSSMVSLDLMAFSQHMVRGKTSCSPEKRLQAQALMDEINEAPGEQGFFWENYSLAGDRMFFTEDNALRIDAARQRIKLVSDPDVQSYLYYCGLEALSRVLNTAGTHGAFMKSWKDRALTPFSLTPQTASWTPGIKALQGDVTSLVGTLCEDILYLDPPYTTRQYGPNYHLYDTFVSSQASTVKGKTGLPSDVVRSDFCKKEPVVQDLIQTILSKTKARLVLISYSSDGTISLDNMLTSMMRGFNQTSVELQVREYTRFRSAEQDTSKNLSANYLREYLFIIEREELSALDLWGMLTDPDRTN